MQFKKNMGWKNKRYLNTGMANLLILLCCMYALFVCYSCSVILSDDVDFGVLANTKNEDVWRVSE